MGCAKIHNFSLYIPKTKHTENEKKFICIFLYFLLGIFFGDFENIYSEIAEKDAEKTRRDGREIGLGKWKSFLNVIILYIFFMYFCESNGSNIS